MIIPPPQKYGPDYYHNFAACGAALQKQALSLVPEGQTLEDLNLRWLKTDVQYPAFADIIFQRLSLVFAVLIDPLDDQGQSTLCAEVKDRFGEAARSYHLIPCRFPMKPDHTPVEAGWNLRELDAEQPVDPMALDATTPQELSAWEKTNLAVHLTCQWMLQHHCSEFENLCFLPGLAPQIWFHDAAGHHAWVCITSTDAPFEIDAFVAEHPALKDLDGYRTTVELLPPEGAAPDSPLYRGTIIRGVLHGLVKIYAPKASLLDAEDEAGPKLGQPPPETAAPQEEKEVSGKGCLLYLLAGVTAFFTASLTLVHWFC